MSWIGYIKSDNLIDNGIIRSKRIAMLMGPFFLFLCFTVSYAQTESSLVLRKAGTDKEYVFRPGEYMRFRLKGEKEYSRGQIMEFKGDSTIRFDRAEIDFDQIERIDIRPKRGGSQGSYLIAAGIGFYLIDGVNTPGRRTAEARWDAARTSMILMGSGILLNVLRKKYFKVGGRYYLVIFRKEISPNRIRF